MTHRITLIPGDGVGPEITEATRKVLEATGVDFQWEIDNIGAEAAKKSGNPLPESVLQSIRKNKVALKGPVTTPVGTGFRSVNVALRQTMELYACLRPCKTYPGVPSPFRNVDIVIVRENMEDLYAGIEFQKGTPEAMNLIETISHISGKSILADSGLSIKPISDTRSRRIVRFAFEYARINNRRKVTAVRKSQYHEVFRWSLPLGGQRSGQRIPRYYL